MRVCVFDQSVRVTVSMRLFDKNITATAATIEYDNIENREKDAKNQNLFKNKSIGIKEFTHIYGGKSIHTCNKRGSI